MSGLHPAEHRGLRELYASARSLASHWERLAGRLGGEEAAALTAGAQGAHVLLDELAALTAEHDLHGSPAAQGVGLNLALVRNAAGDLVLERNQALRLALLDVQHVVTLLGYLAALAEQRQDLAMTAFHGRWERSMRAHEDALRAAAVAQAHDPDRAVRPADPGPAGRAGHSLANLLGTIGEAIDRRAGRHQRR